MSTTSSPRQSLPYSRPASPHLSRRTLLRGAGIGALTVAGLGFGAAASTARSPAVLAADLEVVTVTTTSVTLSWVTYAVASPGPDGLPAFTEADTEVSLGPADSAGPPPLAHSDPTPRISHLVTVSGLEPGREYRFEARSAGRRAVPTLVATRTPASPEIAGVVRTLVPPPGRFVGTVAVLNDTHVGEDRHGLLFGDFPRAVEQEPGLPPFAEVMLSAALAEIGGHDVAHLVVNGDLTSEARPTEVRRARELLDGYGRLGHEYSVTRGNHDRPHTPESDPDAGYDTASPIPGTDHFDAFGDAFVPFQTAWTRDVGGLRVLGVDSTHLDAAGGVISAEQFADIERTLADEPDRPTMMLAHHPVTRESAGTNVGGPGFVLADADAQRLQQLHASNPGVFLMLAGHTHRCRVTRGDTNAAVEYLETGSGAGYPGGYTLLHLYTGGYQVNFHRTASEQALRWTRRSRFATMAFLPEYTLGTFHDRNHVVLRDLAGLA